MSERRCPIGCVVRCEPGGTPPCWFEGNDDIESLLEAKQMRERDRVLEVLREVGRPDLATELIAKRRDIDLGIDGARSTWAALSEPQRRLLLNMDKGGWGAIVRRSKSIFYAVGPDGKQRADDVARLPTVRALADRELLAWDGGAFDPEARAVLTDRARFVIKHGKG